MMDFKSLLSGGSFAKDLFGSVYFGKDISGNLKLSFKGLSVKTPDGRYVVKHGCEP
jgi:hypothetical protein